MNQNLEINVPFGIHKIFPWIYEPIYSNLEMDDFLLVKYLAIIGFWLFGFVFILIYTLNESKIARHSTVILDDCFECLDITFILVKAIILSLPFQISFTFFLTPFILISLIYHKFFDRLLMFFAIGEHKKFFINNR